MHSTSTDHRFNRVVNYGLRDLILKVAIEETCSKRQVHVDNVEGVEELLVLLRVKKPLEKVIVLCDLIGTENDLQKLTNLKDGFNLRLLGFYPHVNRAIKEKAQKAGIDYIIPRSGLIPKLRELIGQ